MWFNLYVESQKKIFHRNVKQIVGSQSQGCLEGMGKGDQKI